MIIHIINRHGWRSTLDVPYDITVKELNKRYTRIIGVGSPRFHYLYDDQVLNYDEYLRYYGII